MAKSLGINLSYSAQFLIEEAFKEDVGQGDITTEALGDKGNFFATAQIKLKQKYAVLCGMDIASQIAKYYNHTQISKAKFKKTKLLGLAVGKKLKDGDVAYRGDVVLTLQGRVSDLLVTERIILNFIQQLSGIATKTYEFVQLLKPSKIKLLDTRKTTPGFRVLEKYAVSCGGGVNHRMGLYDQYLIKDNHIDRAGGITAAIKAVVEHKYRLRKKSFGRSSGPKIEIECRSLTEVQEVLAFRYNNICPVAIIMLDNFGPKAITEALALIPRSIKVEVSGNINSKKINELIQITKIAKRPIDYVSVGVITHSASAVDCSMSIDV